MIWFLLNIYTRCGGHVRGERLLICEIASAKNTMIKFQPAHVWVLTYCQQSASARQETVFHYDLRVQRRPSTGINDRAVKISGVNKIKILRRRIFHEFDSCWTSVARRHEKYGRSRRRRTSPFFIAKAQERALRINAEYVSPSLVVTQPTSFDEYTRQLMVPPTVMDLARKASDIRLSAWEVEGIRAQLDPQGGLLRHILQEKAKADNTHPPYIRVACTGKGDYDDLAYQYGYTAAQHHGDAGSPVVLEIWPAQHYSPMHSHGGTTGIIYCLAGQIDVMVYSELSWDATKLGLLTLTPGQCAWLAGDQFAVHKVYLPHGRRKQSCWT